MKKAGSDFGERIQELEIALGSQAALARSLGVSTRTIRRYKNRRDDGVPKNIKVNSKKVRARERYYYYRKTKGIPLPGKRGDIVLNDHAGGTVLADIANNLQTDRPDLVKSILADRPNIAVVILVATFGDDTSSIEVPLTGSDQFERLTADGFEPATHYIAGNSYHDWPSLSAALWLRFRDIYPHKK